MDQVIYSKTPHLTWTIHNYSSLVVRTESEKKELIHSKGKADWYVDLSPNSKESEEYFTIYLNILNQDEIHIYYKLSLEANDGKILKSIISDDIFANPEDWQYTLFHINKNILLLKDDTLIVKCWLYPSSSLTESECFEHINNDLNKRMTESFNEFFISGSFSDIILERIEGNKFPAHKCILASGSPVFKAMFTHNMKENQENKVVIKDVDSVTLKVLLEFMYSNKFDVELCEIDKLFIASDKYQINILKSMCELKLSQQLTMENVVDYFILAHDYNAQKLKTKAINFITENLQEIVENNALKNLEKSNLFCEIIAYISKHYKSPEDKKD